jgi:hypothetical protein
MYLLGNVVMITTDADWSMASNADGRSGTLDMASYCTALPREVSGRSEHSRPWLVINDHALRRLDRRPCGPETTDHEPCWVQGLDAPVIAEWSVQCSRRLTC